MKFLYRLAEESDISEMVNLLRELFAIEKDFHVDPLLQRQGLRLLILSPAAAVIVAHTTAEVVGMVSGQLLISTAEGEPSLHIEDLVVRQDKRHLGIGRQLLELIGHWGCQKGARRMQLLADRDNAKGIEFYLKGKWRKTSLICLRKYNS